MFDDTSIIRKVKKGDKEAFAELLKEYQKPIFNFIYRFFGNYAISSELTQETFLKCFQAIESYDINRKFSTWLYTIAKHLCFDELKKKKHYTVIYEEDGQAPLENKIVSPKNPQDRIIEKENKLQVQQAIQKLPDRKRAAIILYYYQGLSYQEIAETLHITLSNVKIEIFRAKKILLKILGG